MRIFEMCLLILTILLSLWLFFIKSKGPIFRWSVVANSILLVIHVLLENIRWQMTIIYIFALLLLIYCVTVYTYQKEIKLNKVLKVLMKTISIISLFVSAIIIIVMPVPKLPNSTGDFPISTMSLLMTDNSRPEIYTDSDDDVRELMVTVWYPSKDDKEISNKPYIKDLNLFSSTLMKELGLPKFILNYIENVKTQVTVDGPVSDKADKYPLIVFSHGMAVTSQLYTSIIKNLVSNGYIVASIEHTYSTMVTTFPDGKVTTFKTNVDNYTDMELKTLEDIWVDDISFVISQMEGMNSGLYSDLLKDRIDINKIGVLGHSFGGGAAYRACYMDNRIKAAINLDGSIYNIDTKLPIDNKNFMLITSEEYAKAIKDSENKLISFDELSTSQLSELETQGITKQEYEETLMELSSCMDYFKKVISKGNLFLSIDGTKHYNFSDVPLISPLVKSMGMTGKINGIRGIMIVNNITNEFFDGHLKGEKVELLTETIEKYQEVKLENIG